MLVWKLGIQTWDTHTAGDLCIYPSRTLLVSHSSLDARPSHLFCFAPSVHGSWACLTGLLRQ